MEQLKMMKENLTACVQAQMANLSNANAEELGEAVDMIKDLSEAIYYCSITKAMEENEKEKEALKYNRPAYAEPRYYDGGHYDSMSRGTGRRNYNGEPRMYYHGDIMGTYPRYMEDSYPTEIRDHREGKSPVSRRMYMESKELHHDKGKQMKELEKYIKELGEDITEMINDASPEERNTLADKLHSLADRVR